jgi:hypothetical protein
MAVLQYSATEHFKKSELTPLDSLPGVYFFYDFSPIKVCSFMHIYNLVEHLSGVFHYYVGAAIVTIEKLPCC